MSSKRAALAPLAKPLPSGRTVSLSAFAFLYGEMVSYFQARTTSMADLETRLDNAGYGIGVRLLELAAFKDRPAKRDITVLSALQFVSGTLWTHLFGKTADTLQKSTDTANAFMIGDADPATNHFVSLRPELRRVFNPAAFVAGIIRGVLDGVGIPCTVAAVTDPAKPPTAKDLEATPIAASGGAAASAAMTGAVNLAAYRDKTVFVVTVEVLPPTALLAAGAATA